MRFEDDLKSFVSRCVVQIPQAGQIKGGTGFFVARDLVLTCAHVVSSGAATPSEALIGMRWGDVPLTGTLLDAQPWPAVRGPDNIIPGPDLALIRVDEADFDHAWMSLSASPRLSFGASLYIVGHGTVYSMDPKMHSRTATFDEFDWDGKLIHIAECEVPAGTSGGPLVDLEHALILGVVKANRMRDAEMGGLAVPVAAVRDTFPEHWNTCSTNEHHEWIRLRTAIQRFADPVGWLLPQVDRGQLGTICTRHNFSPRDFQKFYENVRATHVNCHPLLPHLAYPPVNFEELAKAVAGELMAEFTDCLHPLVGLIERIGKSVPEDDADYLHRRASQLAEDLGGKQPLLLEQRRADIAVGTPENEGPVICVKFIASEARQDEYRLDAWTFPGRSSNPTRVEVPDRALTMDELERRTLEIIDREMRYLPEGDVIIEFAVPRWMLNEPVETWPLGASDEALGIDYAVVLRCTERSGRSDQRWRTRGRTLHARPVAGADPASQAEWLSCDVVPPRTWFRAYFGGRGKKDLTTVALCHAPSSESRVMLDSCLDVGVPVIIWHRDSCAEHSHSHLPTTDGAGSATCMGAQFEAWMKPLMTGIPISDLPELVRSLRADAVLHSASQGRGLVLLWDDPARVPWADEPPLHAPTLGKSVA